MQILREITTFVRAVIAGFVADDCPTMAAALAYYTVFSLAPLLVVVVSVTGLVFTPEQTTAWIDGRLTWLVGPEGAEQIGIMVGHVRAHPERGAVARWLGTATALYGATAVLVQLQTSLDRAWNVRPDPGLVRRWLARRASSFLLLFVLSALVAASIATSAALSSGLARAGEWLPAAARVGARGAEFTASFLALTASFMAMFKVLPDARIRWVDVTVGAVVTALLFTVGKSAIGVYLAHTRLSTAYGGASSFAVLLVWVYYSWIIVLLGAEITQVWTHRFSGAQIGAQSLR